MKFYEAMNLIQSGEKIRCCKWEKDSYIFLSYIQNAIFDEHENYVRHFDSKDFFEDWEIYEKPQKNYTFTEVVKGLKDGKKFRRPNWGTNTYLQRTILSNGFTGFWEDFEAEDWVEA